MRAAVLLLLTAAAVRAELVGAEVQVVLPRFEDSHGVAFMGSVFTSLPVANGALENGIFVKPGTGSDEPDHARQSFGYFMGFTFIPRYPLLRPGIFAGIAYDEWQNETGPAWKIHPLYGVKLQASILSASFSGRGIGFGLNFGI